MYRRVFEMRQKQGRNQMRDAGRDRKMGMISAGLGGLSALPLANWLKGTQPPPSMFNQPMGGHDIHQPPPLLPNPFRPQGRYPGESYA